MNPMRSRSARRPPSVDFEDVTFAYLNDIENTILKNVSIHVQPGWRVVLVGGSGSG